MPGMNMPEDNTNLSNDSKSTHTEHNSTQKPAKTNVSMDFTIQLNGVFEQYIVLKDAYVKSDINKVKQAAQQLEQSLAGVDMKLLTGDTHTQWMNISDKLNTILKQIQSAGDLELQRKDFSNLSNEFYKTIKSYGLMDKTVYYQFCPMAFGNKGAYWLSTKKEIRNPYYGDQMLECGENRETLRF